MGLRSIQFLQPGSLKRVEFDHPTLGESISVLASDQPSSVGATTAWRLRIWAQGADDGEQSGWGYVGSVRTLPGLSMQRVVAFACVPGARSWAIDGRPEDSSWRGTLRLDLLSSRCCGGPFGVSGVQGVSLATARQLASLAGVSGVVNVPGPLMGWSALGGSVAGSVAIASAPGTTTVPLPANASISEHYEDDAALSASITFTNTVSYLVNYIIPGDGLDAF